MTGSKMDFMSRHSSLPPGAARCARTGALRAPFFSFATTPKNCRARQLFRDVAPGRKRLRPDASRTRKPTIVSTPRPCVSAHHHPHQRKERQGAREIQYFMALCSFGVWRCMEMLRKAREFAKTSQCGRGDVHKNGTVGGDSECSCGGSEAYWHPHHRRLRSQH